MKDFQLLLKRWRLKRYIKLTTAKYDKYDSRLFALYEVLKSIKLLYELGHGVGTEALGRLNKVLKRRHKAEQELYGVAHALNSPGHDRADQGDLFKRVKELVAQLS